MRRRLGWSRVEVLLVLLLILVLGGLGVTGLGHLRETANLTKCRNNLKQIGLAVHNFNDTNGHIPPLIDKDRGLQSIFVNLDPYIEATIWRAGPTQPPDYFHAHSSAPFTATHKGETINWHGGMANQYFRIFVDPSDTSAERLRDVPMSLPDGSTGYYATGSYAANGLAPWGTGTVAGSFPRGTENSVLFGERPQVCRTESGDEVYNLWGVGFFSPHMPAFATLTPTIPEGMRSTGQIAPVEPMPDEAAADRDSMIRFRVGRREAEFEPPDFGAPMQRVRNGRPCDPRLPGSPHWSGMQMLMADGSVRVFGWEMSQWVFWNACVVGSSE